MRDKKVATMSEGFELAHGGESVNVTVEPGIERTEMPVPHFDVFDGCYFFWAPGEEIPKWYHVENGKLFLVGDSSQLPPDRRVVHPTPEEFERFEQ